MAEPNQQGFNEKSLKKEILEVAATAEMGPIGGAVAGAVADKLDGSSKLADQKLEEEKRLVEEQRKALEEQQKFQSSSVPPSGGRFSFLKNAASHLGSNSGLYIFWIFAVLIFAGGPLAGNVYSFDNGVLGYISFAVLIGLLVFLNSSHLLSHHRFMALFLLIGINIVIKYIFQVDNFLRNIIPGDPVIVIWFSFILLIALFLRTAFPSVFGAKFIFIIVLVFVLGFVFTYFTNAAQSGRLQNDFERTQVEIQSDASNSNLIQRLVNQFNLIGEKGRGDVNPTVQKERSYSYLGVIMEPPEVISNSFSDTTTIRVDYSTDSDDPFNVLTTCKINDLTATVTPEQLEVASFLREPAICEFENVLPGVYTAQVSGLYSFSSSLKQPLTLLERSQAEAILNDGGEIEDVVSDFIVAEVDDGPLDFGVSNGKVDGVATFSQPVVIDQNNQNEEPFTIIFELKNPIDSNSKSGDIKLISKAEVGVSDKLQVVTCGTLENLDYTLDAGLRLYDITEHFSGPEPNLQVTCWFTYDEANPLFSATDRQNVQIIEMNVDYTYSITQTVPVTIS